MICKLKKKTGKKTESLYNKEIFSETNIYLRRRRRETVFL